MKETILKAQITGHLQGRTLDTPYRAVLIEREDKEPAVRIDQYIARIDKWVSTPGQWCLPTLLESRAIKNICLDNGQGWYASGIDKAIAEAEEVFLDSPFLNRCCDGCGRRFAASELVTVMDEGMESWEICRECAGTEEILLFDHNGNRVGKAMVTE